MLAKEEFGETSNELNSRLINIKNGANTLIKEISAGLVGREEEALVVTLTLLSKQHAVLIGEAGLAKSLLIRRMAALVDARYFEYLMTKYTVPDEIVGTIDPVAYRQGKYTRMTKGTIVESEVAFIDEIFKGSSDTLNALLTIMNERLYADPSGTRIKVPLLSLFSASNEYPTEQELAPFYDRFGVKHFMKRIDSTKLEEAITLVMDDNARIKGPIMNKQFIDNAYEGITQYMIENKSLLAVETAGLVKLLRTHGLFISDRSTISLIPRLITTYQVIRGGDWKKSAIAISRYLLPNNEEALDSYKKALDDLYPPEIREAQAKLEQAREKATSGDLKEAKKLSAEAVQIAQSLFSKPDKMELFKTELTVLIKDCEGMVAEITRFEGQLAKFKKKAD